MNFGDILDKWEKQTAKTRDEIYDKDAAPAYNRTAFHGTPFNGTAFNGTEFRGERRSRLLRKKPDDSIDLHGLSRDEAWTALDIFFENSRNKGFQKLLVIHGKGNHGPLQGEATLKDISRSFIESCSFAGESGHCSARDGGTGATWVILKESGNYRSR